MWQFVISDAGKDSTSFRYKRQALIKLEDLVLLSLQTAVCGEFLTSNVSYIRLSKRW